MKFRKLPVVVEAELFNVWAECNPFNAVNYGWPKDDGATTPHWLDDRHWVQTLNGPVAVSHGEWIVKGVKGEIYPCAADIFAATYEAVE